ncbi:MAG: hypothetical protein JSV08_08840 [Acidobacteriota bacterium]|nr:MAG: hypothetical protein JSV08_08840 [Acidobacteriota bacterium]
MAQHETKKLDAGDVFPEISLDLVTGASLRLPLKQWTVFLVYRGNW